LISDTHLKTVVSKSTGRMIIHWNDITISVIRAISSSRQE